MTPLAEILTRRIAAQGPLTLADYMAECLLHPQFGYYATRDPFGAAGDFTTAPEISQMFGELIGLCLAQYWLDMGGPAGVLAELGPGRGTLMADILRATRGVPGFHAAMQVVLMEASPTLRGVQRQTLGTHPVTWIDSRADLPKGPLFLVANEFFDALPIRQFTRQGAGWAETVVGLSDGQLCLGRAPATNLAQLSHRLTDTRDGDIVEICPAAAPIIQDIGARICAKGGMALIIDYGDWHSLGDTFQALQNHRFVDPLATPGNADLTAHVDFKALAHSGQPAAHAYTTQGDFLRRLGIDHRAQALGQRLTGDRLKSHQAAHHRLTTPEEMGSLFKVLALHRPGTQPPAGMNG